MKITIQRSALVERLQQVTKAVSPKLVLPILEGVLIETNEELTITGSDTNLTIIATIEDYEERERGRAVIPAKKLLDVVRKMPEKPINIDVDGGSALIKCGSTKVELPALNPEEFPRKSFPNGSMAIISGEDFSGLIEGTAFAVSTNEKTPVLQGVLIQQGGGILTATATDRHRLAKRSISLETDTGADNDCQFVVPVRPLEVVAALKTDTVEIVFLDDSVFMQAGTYQFISSLYDGAYPDTSRLIPTSSKTTVLVDAKRLLQTFELAEKIVEEKQKIVRLEISEGELHITARDGAAGMEESLEAEVSGEGMRLSLNAKYLIDALKSIDSERVEIGLMGPLSPVVMMAEGDRNGLHLVLPYRT